MTRRLIAGTFPAGPGTLPLGPGATDEYDPAQLGARLYSFDPDGDGPEVKAELGDPYLDAAYLALHPERPVVYAVNRTVTGGAVSAWVVDEATLEPVAVADSGGSEPCHVGLTADGRHLFVANYRGPSVSSYLLDADGRPGSPQDVVRHEGSGPDASRQEAPHPHQVLFDPETGHVLVCDLGTDRLVAYRFDDRGQLTIVPEGGADLAPGSGPRHAAFAADGRVLLVCNELSSTVAVLHRRGAGFTIADVLSTLPQRVPDNHPSAIRVAPDGGLAYVANRGHDSVTTLSIDPHAGHVAIADVTRCGRHPRDLLLDPAGQRLLVANLFDHCIAEMPLSSAGRPGDQVVRWSVPNVSSLALVGVPPANKGGSR